jgi:hypothetical protein
MVFLESAPYADLLIPRGNGGIRTCDSLFDLRPFATEIGCFIVSSCSEAGVVGLDEVGVGVSGTKSGVCEREDSLVVGAGEVRSTIPFLLASVLFATLSLAISETEGDRMPGFARVGMGDDRSMTSSIVAEWTLGGDDKGATSEELAA